MPLCSLSLSAIALCWRGRIIEGSAVKINRVGSCNYPRKTHLPVPTPRSCSHAFPSEPRLRSSGLFICRRALIIVPSHRQRGNHSVERRKRAWRNREQEERRTESRIRDKDRKRVGEGQNSGSSWRRSGRKRERKRKRDLGRRDGENGKQRQEREMEGKLC